MIQGDGNKSQMEVGIGNMGEIQSNIDNSETQNNYLQLMKLKMNQPTELTNTPQPQTFNQNVREFSDSSDTSDNEDGNSNQITRRFRKMKQ